MWVRSSQAMLHLTLTHISLCQYALLYLPTIDVRRPKLQERYEIQNQSKFVMVRLRLEQVVVVMDQALYANLHRLHGSTHPYMQTSWALSTPSRTYSTQMGNSSKMMACVTYAFHQESLQNVQYLACHMVECTILERGRGSIFRSWWMPRI